MRCHRARRPTVPFKVLIRASETMAGRRAARRRGLAMPCRTGRAHTRGVARDPGSTSIGVFARNGGTA